MKRKATYVPERGDAVWITLDPQAGQTFPQPRIMRGLRPIAGANHQVPGGQYPRVVAEGFTGNVVLKLAEARGWANTYEGAGREIYLLRSSTSIGAFAPAFGPRRTFFAGLTKAF